MFPHAYTPPDHFLRTGAPRHCDWLKLRSESEESLSPRPHNSKINGSPLDKSTSNCIFNCVHKYRPYASRAWPSLPSMLRNPSVHIPLSTPYGPRVSFRSPGHQGNRSPVLGCKARLSAIIREPIP